MPVRVHVYNNSPMPHDCMDLVLDEGAMPVRNFAKQLSSQGFWIEPGTTVTDPVDGFQKTLANATWIPPENVVTVEVL